MVNVFVIWIFFIDVQLNTLEYLTIGSLSNDDGAKQ